MYNRTRTPQILKPRFPLKTPTSQPEFNFTSGHEIMDLTIQCLSSIDPTKGRRSRITGGGVAQLGNAAPSLPQNGPVQIGTPCKYVPDPDCHNPSCRPCGANYGIWAPGALETIYTRLHPGSDCNFGHGTRNSTVSAEPAESERGAGNTVSCASKAISNYILSNPVLLSLLQESEFTSS